MVYDRTLKVHFAWCEEQKFHPRKFTVGRIQTFLQSGLDQYLTWSTNTANFHLCDLISNLLASCSTLNIGFLFAITSARPRASFLPMVVSAFQVNQDILLSVRFQFIKMEFPFTVWV